MCFFKACSNIFLFFHYSASLFSSKFICFNFVLILWNLVSIISKLSGGQDRREWISNEHHMKCDNERERRQRDCVNFWKYSLEKNSSVKWFHTWHSSPLHFLYRTRPRPAKNYSDNYCDCVIEVCAIQGDQDKMQFAYTHWTQSFNSCEALFLYLLLHIYKVPKSFIEQHAKLNNVSIKNESSIFQTTDQRKSESTEQLAIFLRVGTSTFLLLLSLFFSFLHSY